MSERILFALMLEKKKKIVKAIFQNLKICIFGNIHEYT